MQSGHKPTLLLSLAAEDDVRDIVQYTYETWGEAQARKYHRQLLDGLEQIRKIPTIGVPHQALPSAYSTFQVGKHLIIYWPGETMISVARILHINRDLSLHL